MLCAADLAPLYEYLCEEIGWSPDATQLQRMQSANQANLQELEGKIKDAEDNLGDTEVKEALTAKADYLCRIGLQCSIALLLTVSFLYSKLSKTLMCLTMRWLSEPLTVNGWA